MPLNLFAIGAIIATGVLYDLLFLPSTWTEQTSGFLLPAAKSMIQPLTINKLLVDPRPQPNPLFSHTIITAIEENGEAYLGKELFDLYKVTYLNNPEDDDTFKHQHRAIGRNDEGRFGDIGIRRGTLLQKLKRKLPFGLAPSSRHAQAGNN